VNIGQPANASEAYGPANCVSMVRNISLAPTGCGSTADAAVDDLALADAADGMDAFEVRQPAGVHAADDHFRSVGIEFAPV